MKLYQIIVQQGNAYIVVREVHHVNYSNVLYVEDEVTGLACLNDTMYVVCAKSSTIFLYNTETYSPLEQVIDVDGMTDPTDIVACLHDHQLYLADRAKENSCIWQVSADGHLSEKWLTTADTSAMRHIETLSVTSRRLLVTLRNALYQYSTTDKQHRVIQLSDDYQLCHGVETTRQTFVVSYRTPKWHYGVSACTDEGR